VLVIPAFAKVAKVFPATHDSVAAENRRADALGLKRYGDLAEVQRDVFSGALVPITTPVSAKLPKERRYARPETVAFMEKIDRDFYDMTGHHLLVDSAVRPSDVQRRLRRRNRNAAPADGARASSHERGTTFDLSRKMKRGEYHWLLTRLAYYKARGEILVIEERSCIHVFVGVDTHQGSLEELPIVTHGDVLVKPMSTAIPVQSGRPTTSALQDERA
jgi:hypothetical protein